MENRPKACRLLVLTGASGAGKTTLARRCAELHPSGLAVRHFDSIGVPSRQRMTEDFGSLEAWQRRKTHDWLAALARLEESRILFEGQSRIAFITEAMAAAGLSDGRIVLVDCDDATRAHRLKVDRAQPELVDETILRWAAFLREEARQFGCALLDTSNLDVDEGVAGIMRHFA